MDVIELIGNTGTYLDSPVPPVRRGGPTSRASTSARSSTSGPRCCTFPIPRRWRHPGGCVPRPRRARRRRAAAHRLGPALRHARPTAPGSPFLESEAVELLVERGAALVGIDALNIDDTESGGARPAHSGLLAAGIHVVEHLTRLGELPPRGARASPRPPGHLGIRHVPVRAFAVVP